MRPLQVGELSRKEKALSFEFTAGSVKEQTVYRRILMETKRNAEMRRRRADWIARLFLSCVAVAGLSRLRRDNCQLWTCFINVGVPAPTGITSTSLICDVLLLTFIMWQASAKLNNSAGKYCGNVESCG